MPILSLLVANIIIIVTFCPPLLRCNRRVARVLDRIGQAMDTSEYNLYRGMILWDEAAKMLSYCMLNHQDATELAARLSSWIVSHGLRGLSLATPLRGNRGRCHAGFDALCPFSILILRVWATGRCKTPRLKVTACCRAIISWCSTALDDSRRVHGRHLLPRCRLMEDNC